MASWHGAQAMCAGKGFRRVQVMGCPHTSSLVTGYLLGQVEGASRFTPTLRWLGRPKGARAHPHGGRLFFPLA